MRKKLLLIIASALLMTMFFTISTFASDGVQCSDVRFYDEGGNLISSGYSSGKIIAKSTVTNNTAHTLYPVMMITMYKDGALKGIWYDDTEIAPGATREVKTEFVPAGYDGTQIIKATVIDNLKTINIYQQPAKMLEDNTGLYGIIIDGKELEGYSDSVNFYNVKSDRTDIDIKPMLKDGGSTITTVMPQSIPGVAKIKIVTPNGTERNIDIGVYEKEEQLYSLQGISYYVDGVKYDIKDFDPSRTEYTVILPDNTFYVTAAPLSVYENGSTVTVNTFIEDINHHEMEFGTNSVVYLPGGTEKDYNNTFVKRPSDNGLIPIKNEHTNAVIDVKSGNKIKTYTVEFKAKQPRLTSFNIIGGSDENHKPAFVGGAALNNDNGTTTGTDRAWSFTNISENLIGSSLFMTDTYNAGLQTNEEKGTIGNWYGDNINGEHYNFIADTAGRIYHISQFEITNEEFENNGWSKVNVTPPNITETAWKDKARDWNDYESPIYMNHCAWNADLRFSENSNTLNTGMNIYKMGYVYKKDFEAGEKVSVYNIGAEGLYAGRRSINACVIKWNIDGTNVYPEDNVAGDDEKKDEETGESGGNQGGESGGNQGGEIIPPQPQPKPILEWLTKNDFVDNYTEVFTSYELQFLKNNSNSNEGGEG